MEVKHSSREVKSFPSNLQFNINICTSFSPSQLSQSENSSLSAFSSGLGSRVVPRLLSWDVSRATDSCIKRPASIGHSKKIKVTRVSKVTSGFCTMKQLTVFLLHPDRKLGTSRLKNDTSARKAFKNLRRVLLINRCHTNFVPRPATHSLVAARSVGSGNKMVLREGSRTSIHSCTVAL